MSTIQRGIVALALLVVALVAAEQWGEHVVRVEWDKDIAIRNALFNEAAKQNERHIADMTSKFKKEKKHAESEAGKRAVAVWLHDHGLLPSGLTVRPADSGQAKIPEGADGSSCEPGYSERIKDFSSRCIEDARRVEMCAEWARFEGLETK